MRGLLVGALDSSVAAGPLTADVFPWFWRRCGLAVALCASGNHLAGTLWPPVVEHGVHAYGWRATQAGMGLFRLVAMLRLALPMRGRPASCDDALARIPPKSPRRGRHRVWRGDGDAAVTRLADPRVTIADAVPCPFGNPRPSRSRSLRSTLAEG
ncbi:hypothetical protein ACLBX9_01765 [Methylobacterium sp. A49B]